MELTENQKNKLQALGVKLVYLFGSYAEGKEMPLSDIDIGVVLDGNFSKAYSALYDLFTDLFPGKTVDIVSLPQASLELRCDAIIHGKLFYQASPDARFAFEEKTLLDGADFEPLAKEIDRVILERT